MIRHGMSVVLIVDVTIGGHANVAGPGTHAPAAVSPAGDLDGESCCDDQVEPHRVAAPCSADTILADPVGPVAAIGRPPLPRPAATALPEGHQPPGPLQPPELPS